MTSSQVPTTPESAEAQAAPPEVPPELRAGRRLGVRRVTRGAPALPLLILFGLNAVDELDRTVFNVLAPDIRDHFGLANTGIFGVITLVGIAALGGQVIVGYYADRFSRVRLATAGAAVWGFFTLATGVVPTVGLLIVARCMTAMGRAVNDPTHNSLLADYYPPQSRVGVYGFHRAANSVGQIVGPLLGGGLAYLFGWRAPFLLFWIPTLLLVLLALARLREPVRGGHEREAAGATGQEIGTEEAPPSFGEAWRICYQVRTLRRIWYSLPFLAVSIIGAVALYSIYYDDVFGLNEFQRGVVQAITEPFQLLGIAVGIPIAVRLADRDPGLVLKFLAVVGAIVGVAIVAFAYAPNLYVAVTMNVIISSTLAVLVPGIYGVLSLAIPPRARAMGFSIGALYVIPGLPILVIIGALADTIGIRAALLMLLPVFGAGALIIASAGAFVRSDTNKVRVASLAQAQARSARSAGDPQVLIVRDLDVAYGQTQVLFGVDFHVDEGEIVALLGTNGAGKSTLLKAISGLVDPTAGAIVYDGVDITMSDANRTVAGGIVLVPGGRGVFPTLTVEENLDLAGWLYRRDSEYLRAAIEQALEFFPVLRARWKQKAGNLSGGEQQMLTLGQAFIAQPKLLMIDELSLGLAPVIVEQLLEIVRAIHSRGTTVILVEQSVNIAVTVAQRAVFMEKGEVRFDGPTEELLDRPDILRAVFLQGAAAAQGDQATHVASVRSRGSRQLATSATPDGGTDVPPVLETRGLCVNFGGIRAVDDVDLDVAPGRILGLIGPNGAGKTTVFDAISGFVVPSVGRVLLQGVDVTDLTPHARASLGLGRSFQDARLFPSMTVRQTLSVALERHISTRDPVAAALMSPAVKVAERQVAEDVDRLIELMHLEAFADKFVSELSTGSRRVVDLACTVAHDPSVLLLDEPSSGIAQRETEALGPLLLEIRDKTGAALVVIEHDMPLVTAVADELVALDLGSIIARGTPDDVVNDPRVVECYLGTDELVIKRSEARGDGGSVKRRRGKRAPRRRKEPLRAASRRGS